MRDVTVAADKAPGSPARIRDLGLQVRVRPGLRIVLRQLERYDEAIIPHFRLRNVAASPKSRELLYVRRPRDLEGVAVWMGQHIVLLPPEWRDITSLHTRYVPGE